MVASAMKNPFSGISQRAKANLALLGGGVGFGISSPLARSMGRWLDPFSVVFVRFAFALPFALGFWAKGGAKRLPLGKLWFFTLIFPISVCLYTFSLFHTKVSIAIFSFYVANLLSSLLVGRFVSRERFSRSKVVGLTLALGAVVLLTDPFSGFAPDAGMWLGYLSGITQTFASLYQKKLSQDVDERALTLSQVFGGLIAASVAMWYVKDMSILSLSGSGVLLGLLFGFLFFLINYFMIHGFKHAEISTGTILLSSELLFGPMAAYAIFGETLALKEMLGGLLIAGAVVVASREGK